MLQQAPIEHSLQQAQAHNPANNRGPNILDLLITSEAEVIEDLRVTCPNSNSDHNLISWNLLYSMTKKENEKIFCYNISEGLD